MYNLHSSSLHDTSSLLTVFFILHTVTQADFGKFSCTGLHCSLNTLCHRDVGCERLRCGFTCYANTLQTLLLLKRLQCSLLGSGALSSLSVRVRSLHTPSNAVLFLCSYCFLQCRCTLKTSNEWSTSVKWCSKKTCKHKCFTWRR